MPVTVKKDRVGQVFASVLETDKERLVVGFPHRVNRRRGDDVTNAQLAYIHERGSTAAGIPRRPFLEPGVQRALPRAIKILSDGVAAELAGRKGAGRGALHDAGRLCADEVRRVIDEGNFAPLADATVSNKGHDRPLVDTGQMRRSVTHEVRRKSQ